MLREPGNPKYIQIARELRAEIDAARPGDYLPSERSLCVRFGVNLKTVRGALAFLQRDGLIEKRPGRGSVVLVPGAAATDGSGLSSRAVSRTGTIGLVLPMEPYLAAVVVPAVEQEARRQGCRLLVSGTRTLEQLQSDLGAAREREADALRSLPGSVDGAIWWSAFGGDNLAVARTVQEAGVPLVLVDNPVVGLDCDWVGIDDYDASRHLTRHLISQGHRDLAFWAYGIGEFVSPLDGERILGFLDALRDIVDLGPSPVSLFGLTQCEMRAALPAAAQECVHFDNTSSLADLMRGDRPPTALVVANDHLARRVLAECDRLGVRVPGDLAVASFGDIDRYTEEASTLTCVHQPFARIAERAARLLMRRIADPARPAQLIHLPTRLVLRRSTEGARREVAGRP